MATVDDGLVDSPFGRVTPEVLDILNGGQGAPSAPAAPVAAPVAPQGSALDRIPDAAAQASPVATMVRGGPAPAAVSKIPQDPTDVQDPNSWNSAIGRGIDTMQAQVGGTIEAIGEATGSQYLKDAGADYRAQQLAEAERYGTPDNNDFSHTDFTNAADVGQWVKNTVGGALAPLGTVAASGYAGGLAGERMGAPFGIPGKVAGPIIGAFLGSFGINTGAMQNEIKQLNPDAQGGWPSIAFGAGAGALDAVGLKALTKPFVKWFSPEVAYANLQAAGVPKVMALDAVKGATLDLGKGAATGAAINAAQDTTQAFLAGKVSDHEYNAEQLLDRAVNAAATGAVGGGAVGAGSRILGDIMQNARVANSARPRSSGFADGSKEEGGLLTKVWNAGGREATAPLEPLARTSPAAEEFIRQFRPDMTGEKATGKTVFEDYELRAAAWRNKEKEITHGMDDAQKAALFDEASQPKANITSPKAQALRDLLDEVPADATKAGLKVGYIDGYMPFRPDVDRIINNRAQFEQDISPFIQNPTKVTQDYLDTMAQPRQSSVPDQTGRLTQNPTTGAWEAIPAQQFKGDPNQLRGEVAQGDVAPKFRNLEFQRAFNEVPQSIMNKYAVEQTPKQRQEAVHDYFEGAAHRLAFVDHFGENGQKGNLKIAAAVADAEKQGRTVSRAEVDHMYGLMDAYNGMYNALRSDSLKQASSIASAFLTLKTLPLAALSSLVEFTTPAIRGNITDALASVIPAFSQIAKDATQTLFKGSPRSEWSKLAAEAGLDFAASQSIMAERLGSTIFNRAAAGVTRRFFLANGLSALTHVQRTFAAKTGERIYDDAIFQFAVGLDPTSAKGVQLGNQLRSLGVDIKNQQQAQALYSPSTPSEVAAARQAKVLAVRRFTSQAILEPNAADTPLWMSSGRMQLVAQLKRYPTAYTNIILPQMLRKMSPNYQGSWSGAAAGAIGLSFMLGGMMSIGYIQDDLKRWAKAGFSEPEEDQRTEGAKFMDIANQVGTPMQVQYLTNMFTATRHGTDPVSANIGPFAGVIKEASVAGYRTIMSFQDEPTSGYIWQFLYKQVPFANQIKPGQQAVKDAFDLP